MSNDPENPNRQTRPACYQLAEAHALFEAVSPLKSQLLSINGWLALVHRTQLSPHA